MKLLPLAGTLVALTLLLALPCSAGMVKASDDKLFNLDLELVPPHPTVGINGAVLKISDGRSGRPVDDADIELVPWMTMHGHGSPKKPAIKRTGPGQYRVENIFYTMEGDWDLLVTIQRGQSRDAASFEVLGVKK